MLFMLSPRVLLCFQHRICCGNSAKSVGAWQPEDGSEADKVLQAFDLVFVVLFTVELAINMFGNLFVEFFMDGWNYFDTFVVIVSLVATFADENPGLVSAVSTAAGV